MPGRHAVKQSDCTDAACLATSSIVKRRYRVQTDKQFQEIRRQGRSYANHLLVLCALPNHLPYSRFGFAVNSRIGNAVRRNRIKRRLREIIRLQQEQIQPGWDIVLIARQPIRSADYHAMESACARLLRRAQLFQAQTPIEEANGAASGLEADIDSAD